jgi:flagellar biosynthesis protein FlhF
METGLSVAYYTNGQKIPEDLHHAESVPLVRMAVERLKKLKQQLAVAV